MDTKAQLLAQLNRFTRREHTEDEVYLFDLILCDNEIDRDGDRFSDAALESLAKQFVGVTGIFDHNPRSGNQAARIFAAELCTDPARKTKTGEPYRFLKANAYMVRTAGNADLIREIDAGIKKEVSVSCAVTRQICSVCGTNRIAKPCNHIKGSVYGGQRCFCTLDGVSDVYEWSFVAIPAQRHAGVTKTFGEAVCDTEKEALRTALGSAAETLGRMTEVIRRDVVRLCFRNGDNAIAKALADSAAEMDADQLMKLRETLAAEPAVKLGAPQLTAESLADYSTGKEHAI